MLFPSRTVLMHIARGILGFGFLAAALHYAPLIGWWAVAPALAALVCLGGCPMCWTVGLFMTIFGRKGGPSCPL